MKGGITSGIVYPQAVAQLHARYDFHSIGGASAGAIGAALTAAAQYGEYQQRRDPGRPGGFGALTAASEQIGVPGVLEGLFQPSRRTTWVFRLLFGLQGAGTSWPGRVRVTVAWMARYFWSQVLVAAGIAFGGLLGVLYGFGGSLGDQRWYGWPLLAPGVIVTALLGLVGAILARVLWTVRGLPATFYGACTGMPAEGGREALTQWLHRQIQACAGRADGDTPLTFADLSRPRRANEKIILEMMTTDLSAARPLNLPFVGEAFLYSPAEFARLFPADVLGHLERVSAPVAVVPAPGAPTDLRTFPSRDLPVVVATRMSLSFPVLICAVPLWVQGTAGAGPIRHWFSDGGIASNFPMHFFDAWLPSRPTFGLDLVPSPRGEKGSRERVRQPRRGPSTAAGPTAAASSESRESKRPRGSSGSSAAASSAAAPPVTLAPAAVVANAGPRVRSVAQIRSLVGFLLQILDTSLNWRDTLQAEMPGFRDRIRSVQLPDGTGGIHITMSPEQIAHLAASGGAAGEDLLSTFDWEEHLFARFTLLMRQLQKNIVGTTDTTTMSKAFTPEFQEMLETLGERFGGGEAGGYNNAWGIAARDRTLALLGFVQGWAAAPSLSFIQGDDPTPPPVMRMTPKV
ncbi:MULTISPECIES: patatin-like phospholipase family protein [unclassified Pseudofrankia]|uniref:patatin-like phospholipase family protein n=1 Tax=unclassified Pseudofrankia TaxID=2994372 RepID=UPI0009F654C6|nr:MULTISPECIES: patatin-like phospholipase family protein [unclassified Pseudofrankia]MDT3446911.1 patatin-like phospholipase family protein [Pseudofrankia sp. BMG5.37]